MDGCHALLRRNSRNASGAAAAFILGLFPHASAFAHEALRRFFGVARVTYFGVWQDAQPYQVKGNQQAVATTTTERILQAAPAGIYRRGIADDG